MKYVFGPVLSRRLGRSLGVDPIPQKTCNWNCVYCQLGRTTPITDRVEEYYPREEIVAEIEAAVRTHGRSKIDWVSFVGSGEPTLHSGIGWMIRETEKRTHLPVAVITNGSLLYIPEVRAALLPAGVVLPSLDAGSADLFRKINRPHPQFTFERLVEGLITFSAEYEGQLWIEVVLISGVNDSEGSLRDLADVIGRIGPDQVHLNLPTRPPAESWVEPAGEEVITMARSILGDVARVYHGVEGTHELGGYGDIVEAILDIIGRHPMSEKELTATLDAWFPGEVEDALAELAASGRAHVVERYGERFWSGSDQTYSGEPTRG
jgi:wyosine [tRNA(Phe)-imidazoG37] synthetase (radical SAM superfamily)